MKAKLLGSILILVATTGFGFHIWKINNNTKILENKISKLNNERDLVILSYDQYKWRRIKSQLHRFEGNFFASIEQSEKAVLGKENSFTDYLNEYRLGLKELAFTTDNSKEKAEFNTIKDQIDSHNEKNELDKIKDKIMKNFGIKLQEIQNERDGFKSELINTSNKGNNIYIIYLILQVFGIFLVALGEFQASTSKYQKAWPINWKSYFVVSN